MTQFLTYRGMLDVDDLISNCCGAAVGLLSHKAVEKLSRDDVWKWTGRAMLTAGLIGCIMVAVPAAKSNISTRITEQFQFSISSLTMDDKVNITGDENKGRIELEYYSLDELNRLIDAMREAFR